MAGTEYRHDDFCIGGGQNRRRRNGLARHIGQCTTLGVGDDQGGMGERACAAHCFDSGLM